MNQIGLSLEPDKGSIIYLRQKTSERNVIIFLFSRACGDEDSDDYWILTVFYYTLDLQPELWGAGEGSAAPREVHPFGDVGGAWRCGFTGVGRVCLPSGTAEADVESGFVKRAAGVGLWCVLGSLLGRPESTGEKFVAHINGCNLEIQGVCNQISVCSSFVNYDQSLWTSHQTER